MESKQKERFLNVKSVKVSVPEEVYQVVFQQINRTRYIAKQEDRCGQPDHRLCNGDCATCRYQQMGNLRLWHIFSSDEAACAEKAYQKSADDLLVDKEMWQQVYKYADKAVKSGCEVLRLRIECEWSLKQIADELGMTIPHVEYKLRRIFSILKEHPEIFF